MHKQQTNKKIQHIHGMMAVKQAPRAWYSRLSLKLHSLAFTHSKADKSLFLFDKAGVTMFHSLKNRTGDRTGEALGLGFYWLNHWFTCSLSGFLRCKIMYFYS